MKKLSAVAVILFALIFSANVASAFPASVGSIGSFLNGGYFNGADYVYPKDFSGTWYYTAIAYDAGNVNITQSPNSNSPITFTSANTSNFGEWKSVNFSSGDIYFTDATDGWWTDIDLDAFNTNWDKNFFSVYKLTADSSYLNYLADPFKMRLLKDTIIVGWEDAPFLGDNDYNDLIIALYRNGEGGYEPVPEPATMLLLGAGLLGLAGYSRRKFVK